MKKYMYLMAGGAAGAVLRFYTGTQNFHLFTENFPAGTFIANISGAFMLAFFLRWAFDSKYFSENLHAGIAPGFLGAFTTFSTLCKESSLLILEGNYLMMTFYLVASVTIGLTSALLGFNFSGWMRRTFYGKVEAEK